MMAKRKAPTARQRRRTGSTKRGPNRAGAFPMSTRRQVQSAIKLRGHARSRKTILDRASRWANRHNDAGIKRQVANARARDRTR